MKYFFALSAFLLVSIHVEAQLNITAFPFASRNFNVESLSLGSATVSMDGEYGNAYINPAGIGIKGALQISPDFDQFSQPHRTTYKRFQLNSNYRFDESAFAIYLQGMESGDQVTSIGLYEPFPQKFVNREFFAKAVYSYSFNKYFSIGAGLNYLYSSESSGNTVTVQKVSSSQTLSIDVGLQYQFPEIQFDHVKLTPHTGFALTNFGKALKYTSSVYKDPLPTKLQAGIGLSFISTNKKYGKNLIEVKLLQDVSKLMARMEMKTAGLDTSFVAMNPLKTLLKSWDNYTYFDWSRFDTATLIEQIWWHSGIEVKFLETFSLRWGYEQAGKAEDEFSYKSIGVGLDLFYVDVDYVLVRDIPDSRNFMEGDWWQLTGRIPLDGKRPDTLLDVIF